LPEVDTFEAYYAKPALTGSAIVIVDENGKKINRKTRGAGISVIKFPGLEFYEQHYVRS